MKIQQDRFRHSKGYVLEYEVSEPETVSSPYLHILFHGFSRIEKHVPPVFARKQWKQAAQSVCLSFSDPIHRFTQDSCCGWFLLGEEEFVPKMYDLRATLLERHGLKATVWHGLSSGGYAALKHCMRAGATTWRSSSHRTTTPPSSLSGIAKRSRSQICPAWPLPRP